MDCLYCENETEELSKYVEWCPNCGSLKKTGDFSENELKISVSIPRKIVSEENEKRIKLAAEIGNKLPSSEIVFGGK